MLRWNYLEALKKLLIQITSSIHSRWDYKIETLKKIWQFVDDETLYYAASLSFFTIFALLPILALIIAFMSTNPLFVDYKDMLIMYVLDFVNPTHSQTLSDTLQKFLVNIEELGSLGFFYLIFIFTMFFQDYEHIINKIHNTKKRGLIPTAFLYISFIILIPLFLIIFTYISTVLEAHNLQIFLNFIFALFFITLLFIISVNTKVTFKSAFISAFITLNVLKLTQIIFSYYISYNEALSTIYGTLSVIFFMFLWVYISWIIYLYGVKICYLFNTKALEQ